MTARQIAIKLNEKKYRELLNNIRRFSPSATNSETVARCIYYLNRYFYEKDHDGKTRFDYVHAQYYPNQTQERAIIQFEKDFLNWKNQK